MFANQLRTATIAVLVLVAAVGPAVAAGGQASNSVTATVKVTDTATVVTVQEDGGAATNAEVSIEPAAGGQFVASGTYTVAGDGTIRLPAPSETTTVRLGVKTDNMQSSTTMRLQVPDSGTWKKTVSVDAGATADSPEEMAVDSNESADAAGSSSVDAAGSSSVDAAGSSSADAAGSSSVDAAGSSSADAGDGSYSAGVRGGTNPTDVQGSADAWAAAPAASAEGGVAAWTEAQSASKLLGQFEFLFDAGAKAPSHASMGTDVAASGESATAQSDASARMTSEQNVSDVADDSVDAGGEVASAGTGSSVSGEMDGSVGADAPASSAVEAQQRGSATADATTTDASAALDVLGNVSDLMEINGQVQGAASSE